MTTGNAAQQATANLPPITGTGGTAAQMAGSYSPMDPVSIVLMRTDINDTAGSLYNISLAQSSVDILPTAMIDKLHGAMDAAYGKGGWTQAQLKAGWKQAVTNSANILYTTNKKAFPDIIFENMVAANAKAGLNAGGTVNSGGGNGTSYATQKSVNLTDPSTARGLIDTALSDHLGRQANPQEQAAFLKALNVQQQASPTMTEQTTTKSGKSSSTTSQTTGGFNASTFADEYAAGQQGAGEFQAATSLLDSFIGALGAKV